MVADSFLEGLVELAVVEEDVGVVVPAVEVALDGANGLQDALELLVSGQDDKGGIGPGLGGVGGLAACEEDFVVFFADFSAMALAIKWVRRMVWWCVPNGWGRAGRDEDAAVVCGMTDKEDENENDDNDGEQDDDTEGNGDGRVSS